MSARLKEALQNLAMILVVLAAAILLLQLGLPHFGIPSYILPLPSSVFITLFYDANALTEHLLATLYETTVGFLMALLIGVLLALGLVYSRVLRVLLLPFLSSMNAFPKIAIAPLLVIWFGVGFSSKIMVAFLIALFPIFIGAATGLGQVELDWLDLAALCGASEWRVFTKLRLSNSVPYILDACKVAAPMAAVGAITGEFISGDLGLGYVILRAQYDVNTALVFSTLILVAAMTSVFMGVFLVLERWLLRWRPPARMAAKTAVA
jgi:NitT/TauT family transport system permease protein